MVNLGIVGVLQEQSRAKLYMLRCGGEKETCMWAIRIGLTAALPQLGMFALLCRSDRVYHSVSWYRLEFT